MMGGQIVLYDSIATARLAVRCPERGRPEARGGAAEDAAVIEPLPTSLSVEVINLAVRVERARMNRITINGAPMRPTPAQRRDERLLQAAVGTGPKREWALRELRR